MGSHRFERIDRARHAAARARVLRIGEIMGHDGNEARRARLGACPSNDAPAAAAPHRHLSAIISLTWYPPCARNDRGNLLDVGRPRDGDHCSDRLLIWNNLSIPDASI